MYESNNVLSENSALNDALKMHDVLSMLSINKSYYCVHEVPKKVVK